MVVESFESFFEWLPGALFVFFILAVTGIVLGVFVGYIVATFRHGPFEAFYVVAQVIAGALPDFLYTSPRRIGAIARLSIKEALRRRVVIVTLIVFLLSLLFGSWFMDFNIDHPDRVWVSSLLWETQLLILLMVVLISSFSLPEDIKNKTIYTVVTKPVRSTEIVVGRTVGFVLLGTALLALMGLLSFFSVWRGLSHTHLVVGDSQTIAELVPIDPDSRLNRRGKRVSDGAIREGETSVEMGHRHPLELVEDIRDPSGPQPLNLSNVVRKYTRDDGKVVYERLICMPVGGHTHEVTIRGEGPHANIELGPAAGYFRARVPLYAADLYFYDAAGDLTRSGIDVGREWRYRGFIDGGMSTQAGVTLSRGVFDFKNFDPAQFGDAPVVNMELNLAVFRTYVADIQKRVMASIQFESIPANPDFDAKYQADLIVFETKEYAIQTLPIPRTLRGRKIAPDGTVLEQGDYHLFEHYGQGGQIRLVLRCEDRNQYIGVARGDVYFRLTDDLYGWNFFKGYVGLWTQMVVVVAFGVAFSTFLSAPLTIVAVLIAILIGFVTPFIRELTNPEASGGGPIESFYRVVTQKNMEVPLDANLLTALMKQTDYFLVQGLNSLTYIAPSFPEMDYSDYLVYGFSISPHRLATTLFVCAGFVIGLSVFGYFCLKTREIAKA